MSSNLVVYFSASGITAGVAEKLAKRLRSKKALTEWIESLK